jgi:tetratricopeptide (TPR) repeat protein
MNDPFFTQLRREIDDAITFNDQDRAGRLIDEGLRLAREKESLGETLYFRAQEAIIGERFPEAIDLLRQALTYNPLDGAAYNDVALCLVEMGKIEGVPEIFDKGIAAEPDYATIHHNKGWFLNKIGRHSEALVCFERALAFEPGRVVTWENMANAFEAQGRISDAVNAYKKALFYLHASHKDIQEQLKAQIERLGGKING